VATFQQRSAVVNSWKFCNLVNGEKSSQFDYRSKLVLSLLKSSEKLNEETINESTVSISNTNLGRSSKNVLPTAWTILVISLSEKM